MTEKDCTSARLRFTSIANSRGGILEMRVVQKSAGCAAALPRTAEQKMDGIVVAEMAFLSPDDGRDNRAGTEDGKGFVSL